MKRPSLRGLEQDTCDVLGQKLGLRASSRVPNINYESPPFLLSGASETRARMKITPREKGGTRWGETPPGLAFLAWGGFHALRSLYYPTGGHFVCA